MEHFLEDFSLLSRVCGGTKWPADIMSWPQSLLQMMPNSTVYAKFECQSVVWVDELRKVAPKNHAM